MFDEMSNKKPKLWPGETSSGGGGGGDATIVAVDRLSSLPDALLHNIMSFLRAWEVACTCVLSRRWRHLWATAPCIDLRVWRLGRHRRPPYQLAGFVYHFLLERELSAPVDTLRLLSSPVCDKVEDDEDYYYSYSCIDVDIWICAAIKRGVRVIQLAHHPLDETFSDFRGVNLISCHLKHLELSGSMLCDRTLQQLSSQCPSLEVLDLKKCDICGQRISSTSLKSLAIVKCRIMADVIISTPNIVSLCCVTPHHRAPLFKNLGSITVGTIVLNDSFLYLGYEYKYKDIDKDAIYEASGSDSDCSVASDLDNNSDADSNSSSSDSDAGTCEYSEIENDYEDKQYGDYGVGHNNSKHGTYHHPCCRSNYGYNDYHYYRSITIVDRNNVLGGHNIIQSLANATSLELSAEAGEVYTHDSFLISQKEFLESANLLYPEGSIWYSNQNAFGTKLQYHLLTIISKLRVQGFKIRKVVLILDVDDTQQGTQNMPNLKTLSLGEWSLAADFDPLVFFLQHTPNLERLYVELKLDDSKKVMESSGRPEGRSFAWTHLKMVKIKYCKHDTRVHLLARLFRANGVPIEKIYVRQTRSTYCPSKS